MILQKIQEGVCPFCGNDGYHTIECTDSGIEDDFYFYEMLCMECKHTYKEWYKLEFSDIQVGSNLFIEVGKDGVEVDEESIF